MTKYNARETIETILSTAAQLFIQNGIGQTSMMDIADKAGISKGAIYHHFKSKEQIVQAVTDRHIQLAENTIQEWLSDIGTLSGKQKLRQLLEKSLTIQETAGLERFITGRIKSPEYIVMYMRNCMDVEAKLIAGIIRDGVSDSSIVTKYPDECAEVFLILFNIWCDPIIFPCDSIKLMKRLKFFQHLMNTIGLDIFDDELLHKAHRMLYDMYLKGEENEQ